MRIRCKIPIARTIIPKKINTKLTPKESASPPVKSNGTKEKSPINANSSP